MERETHFFSEFVPVQAVVGLPDQGKGPFPAVLLLHGHARHKNDGLDRLSELLNDAGYVTLRFDFRGCGETVYGRCNIMCATTCPEDARNAVTYLQTLEEVDGARIGVTGISLGGITTVCAAATDPRIRCAVSMSSPANLYRNMEQHFLQNSSRADFEEVLRMLEEDRRRRVVTGSSRFVSSKIESGMPIEGQIASMYEDLEDPIYNGFNENFMTLASLESLLNYQAEDYCPRVNVPIRYLHGAEDQLVDPEECRRLFDLTASAVKDMRIMPGIDHNMPIHPRRDEVFAQVIDWFEKYNR